MKSSSSMRCRSCLPTRWPTWLGLALCFKPPVRVLLTSITIALVLLGGAFLYRDTQLNPERYERKPDPRQESPKEDQGPLPLIEEVDLVVDFHAGTLTYFMPLSVIIDIDSPPDFNAICEAAEQAYDQALVDQPPPEARSKPFGAARVKFMARAGFDPDPNIYYPSGSAYRSRNGDWICQPAFPVDPENP